MATTISSFCRLVNLRTSSSPFRRKVLLNSFPTRHLHTPDDPPLTAQKPSFTFSPEALDPDERHTYDLLSPDEKLQYESESRLLHEHMTSREVESELNRRVSQAAHDISSKLPRPPKESLIKEGLFAMGESDPQNTGEDEDFDGDDISSTAHGELEQHREMREYARIIAWEMPLLSKLAKPFTPPPLTHPLRFRYTNYMGETHPAASKVVCEFCTRDLSPSPLSEAQRVKFTKLLGSRYNLSTDLAKISCESFETQAQNKRYLGDLVDTLIAEAQNSEDMFEDVPVDTRHVRVRKRNLIAPFPEAWKLTDERREYLERKWGENRRKEIEKGERQLLVDGVAVIEEAAQAIPAREGRGALTQPSTAAMKGKGKGRTMRAR